jgi:hypothetical protein
MAEIPARENFKNTKTINLEGVGGPIALLLKECDPSLYISKYV